MNRKILFFALIALIAGCVGKPVKPPIETPLPISKVEPYKAVSWEQVDGWLLDRPAAALETFKNSCKAIGRRQQWQLVCAEVAKLDGVSDQVARKFFEDFFQPNEIRNEDGSVNGLITGYYGPELDGSRIKTEQYKYPLYRQPDDLLI
ncbi:MAG: transglycosylase, partial [Deltaproteobacteria bacterium]